LPGKYLDVETMQNRPDGSDWIFALAAVSVSVGNERHFGNAFNTAQYVKKWKASWRCHP